jgi:hypothetical protein
MENTTRRTLRTLNLIVTRHPSRNGIAKTLFPIFLQDRRKIALLGQDMARVEEISDICVELASEIRKQSDVEHVRELISQRLQKINSLFGEMKIICQSPLVKDWQGVIVDLHRAAEGQGATKAVPNTDKTYYPSYFDLSP